MKMTELKICTSLKMIYNFMNIILTEDSVHMLIANFPEAHIIIPHTKKLRSKKPAHCFEKLQKHRDKKSIALFNHSVYQNS